MTLSNGATSSSASGTIIVSSDIWLMVLSFWLMTAMTFPFLALC